MKQLKNFTRFCIRIKNTISQQQKRMPNALWNIPKWAKSGVYPLKMPWILITRKQFIASQTRKCYRNTRIFGRFWHNIRVQSIATWCVHCVQSSGQFFQKISGRKLNLRVICAIFFWNNIGKFRFIKLFFVKTNRKSINRTLRILRHQSHHRTRINAARKERPQRHIAHHSALNGSG